MKTVILCGGMGTRLAEETGLRPKPMVTVGGRPIIWHIMQHYGHQGFNDFVLALGYKGEVIKEFFLNFYAMSNDFSIDLESGAVEYEHRNRTPWRVRLVDTGEKTMTGGRLLRLKGDLLGGGTFMLTYGDGVADIDINRLLAFHREHGRLATVTAVHPMARFGELGIEDNKVREFHEKPQSAAGWINGGFFVFEPGVFDYLESDETVLERSPLEQLSADGQLMAYQHEGFWQCMDTLRDRQILEEHWASGRAPWYRR